VSVPLTLLGFTKRFPAAFAPPSIVNTLSEIPLAANNSVALAAPLAPELQRIKILLFAKRSFFASMNLLNSSTCVALFLISGLPVSLLNAKIGWWIEPSI